MPLGRLGEMEEGLNRAVWLEEEGAGRDNGTARRGRTTL
jgi:hypothetical protein